MALVKYGGGIVQASGSIGGNVFARNRYGNYMRARTKPVNPRSNRQAASRLLIAFLAEQWRESPMTPAIRGAWETYAAAVNWNNALGEIIKLTGFQHFIRCNARRIQAGLTIVTAAPTDLTLPGAILSFAVTGSAATQLVSVAFDDTDPAFDEDGASLIIHQGRPQEPTRNFFGGPYRYVGEIDGNAITPPTSPVTLAAGFVLTEGQKIWMRGSIVRADGRASNWFYSEPFIVAA